MSSDQQARLHALFREEAAETLDELRQLSGRLGGSEGLELHEAFAGGMRLAHNLNAIDHVLRVDSGALDHVDGESVVRLPEMGQSGCGTWPKCWAADRARARA